MPLITRLIKRLIRRLIKRLATRLIMRLMGLLPWPIPCTAVFVPRSYVEYQRKQRMVVSHHRDALNAMAAFWWVVKPVYCPPRMLAVHCIHCARACMPSAHGRPFCCCFQAHSSAARLQGYTEARTTGCAFASTKGVHFATRWCRVLPTHVCRRTLDSHSVSFSTLSKALGNIEHSVSEVSGRNDTIRYDTIHGPPTSYLLHCALHGSTCAQRRVRTHLL